MLKSLANLFSFDLKKHTTGKNEGKTSSQHGGVAKAKDSSFDFIHLIKSWEEIVGPRLSKHTRPQKIVAKKLYILTGHPAFSQQLYYHEDLLISKITVHFPSLRPHIKSIHFLVNPNYFKVDVSRAMMEQMENQKTAKQQLHPYSPLYQIFKREAEHVFSFVEDPEIKNSLMVLYIQSRHS